MMPKMKATKKMTMPKPKRGILGKARRYGEAVRETERLGRELLVELENLLRKVIPDIRGSLGWAEAGIETLCFWSEEKRERWEGNNEGEYLSTVLGDIFSGYGFMIDCPFGICLSEEEVEEIRRLLCG